MQDHELYRRILGFEAPWNGDFVELKLDGRDLRSAGARFRDRVAMSRVRDGLQAV